MQKSLWKKQWETFYCKNPQETMQDTQSIYKYIYIVQVNRKMEKGNEIEVHLGITVFIDG